MVKQTIDEEKVEQYSSDSDTGLPPPLPQKKTGFSLAIGGLGLSTLAGEGGKTAEQIADMKTYNDSKKQKKVPEPDSGSDSDLPMPPPVPLSKP